MGYFAGIDIGSLTCDAVIVDETAAVIAAAVVPTGANNRKAIAQARDAVLASASLADTDLSAVISTGYGRENVTGRDKSVTEITCHAKGAFHLFPRTRLVIDIGGQDSKSISLSPQGKVTDFAMNDKCAAGTGRFLEVMARTLEVELDDLGPLADEANEDLAISSMCTVFAESEVVSLVSQGKSPSNITRGLCRAIAQRTFSLAKRVGLDAEVTMTGGVAKNSGVVHALEDLIELQINIPEEPQIVGALGAALIARDRALQLA